MFKIGLLVAVLGAIVLFTGGGLIAYSQIRSSGADILREAFEAAKNSQYLPVVARVNGTDIPGDMVTFHLVGAAGSLAAMPETARAGLKPPTPQDVLNSLIDGELAYHEAVRRGLTCSDQEVQRLADENITSLPPEVAEALAAGMRMAVADLDTDPRVLDGYGKQCAVSKLRASVTPEDARRDSEAIDMIWRDFRASLRQDADIEILDDSLR